MIETARNPVTSVMRALADPTRRAVFERVFESKEISVAELTRGSGVTQGAISQHLKSLKQAGLVAERAEGRNVYYRAVRRKDSSRWSPGWTITACSGASASRTCVTS
ncbi:DNA-binding transcriptional ArsR family regulator [Bradyrhizobium sp. LB7.1]